MTREEIERIERKAGLFPPVPLLQQEAQDLLRHIEELEGENERLREALELAEGYLVERGIEHKGTVGRTIVLPAIRAALKEAQGE